MPDRRTRRKKAKSPTDLRAKGFLPPAEAAAALRVVADKLEKNDQWIKWALKLSFEPAPVGDDFVGMCRRLEQQMNSEEPHA